MATLDDGSAGTERGPDEMLRAYLEDPRDSTFADLLPFLHEGVRAGVRRARSRLVPALRTRVCAEDLEQDGLLHLIDRNRRVLRRFDAKRGRLVPFVGKVTFHRSLDMLARYSPGPPPR